MAYYAALSRTNFKQNDESTFAGIIKKIFLLNIKPKFWL